MTSDPAYPDAAAEYLYRESKVDDTVHYRSEFARIKIFKESAKDLATVNLGYYKGFLSVEAISGRTIHADGTIVPLKVKAADLMRVKEGETEIHDVVFNLPSVEVGSILEYYYQVRYGEHSGSIPLWEIQQEYPVRKEHFYFQPLRWLLGNSLMWYVHLPSGKSLNPDVQGRFIVDLENVPPLPTEEWAPPIASLRYQVIFYFTASTSVSQYWETASKSWLKDVEHFAEPTDAIRAAAAGLVAPADSEIDKAKKIYNTVQAFDNTDFTRKKSESELKQEGLKAAKRAEDTWKQKSGSKEDIALLYLSLLRGAGLTAYPMKVVNRDGGVFNSDYLSFYQLNDLVIIFSTGGKEIVLDPGEKMCPFEMVHWKHTGAGGVRQTDKGVGPWVTPLQPFSANTVTRRAELTLSADGSVTGKLQFGMTGQQAMIWRQRALSLDEDGLKQSFDKWLVEQVPSGVQAHLVKFNKIDDPNSDLTAIASVSGSPGATTGKRLLLPASFFTTSDQRTFIDQPHRQLAVDMHFAEQLKDGVLYHLPPGYSVEGAPQAASIPWPSHAVFQIKSAASGSDVTVVRGFGRAFTFLGADEYGLLRDFYQKVAAADQQSIVLTSASTVKGN